MRELPITPMSRLSLIKLKLISPELTQLPAAAIEIVLLHQQW